ncbi:uncharacterized protein KY384_001131 [Bacidia gigantensis]|uniref:uncharacterized protein n=1 Tax=Bacidia gigantensis TaxID=2732470 RepID=UPI001D0362F9|nr:uncharacterized protein KY384_001131 [Bacidia gigantensis]KAG8534287.1 hypothetical protein KY384_001131 [Bacidia gigantensis]
MISSNKSHRDGQSKKPNISIVAVETTLSALGSAGLACLDPQASSFKIHQTVRKWIQTRQCQSSIRSLVQRALQVLIKALETIDQVSLQRIAYEDLIIPHMTSCLSWAERVIPQDRPLLDPKYWMLFGRAYWRQGVLQSAERAFREACKLCEVSEDDGCDKQTVLLQLAGVLLDRGQFKQTQAICEAELRQGNSDLQKSGLRFEFLECLGQALIEQENVKKAEAVLKEALLSSEDVFGCNCQETMRAVEALTSFYQQNEGYEKAEMLQRRRIIYLEHRYGSADMEYINAMRNLAVLCRKQGKYSDTFWTLKTLLQLCDDELGEDHPDSIELCAEIAEVCTIQGHSSQASQMFKRAITSVERVLGPNHDLSLRVLQKYAYALYSQKRYCEAEILCQKIMSRRKRSKFAKEDDTRILEILEKIQRRLDGNDKFPARRENCTRQQKVVQVSYEDTQSLSERGDAALEKS